MSRHKRRNNEFPDKWGGFMGMDDWGMRNEYSFWQQIWAELTGTYDPRRGMRG